MPLNQAAPLAYLTSSQQCFQLRILFCKSNLSYLGYLHLYRYCILHTKVSRVFGAIVQTNPMLLLTFLLLSLPLATTAFKLTSHRRNPESIGIYICSERLWGGHCDWHEILPEDRKGGKEAACLKIHHEGGMGSVGPDWGIGVDLYLEPGCVEGTKRTGPLICPGWQFMDGFYDIKRQDIWVKAFNIPQSQQASDRDAPCPTRPDRVH